MKEDKLVNVFTYGTLMKGQSNHYILKDYELTRKEASLKGYKLYSIKGAKFPGIKKENSIVLGEIYKVDLLKLQQLDYFEGEGYLYKRELVNVKYYNDEGILIEDKAYVYVYLKDNISEYNEFNNIKWNSNTKYLYYICYGSNLYFERFKEYLNKCSENNKDYPLDSFKIDLYYELYFARSSSKWDDGGVAFLDISKKIDKSCVGRAYLIKEEQLKELKILECGKSLLFNKDKDIDEIDGWYGNHIKIGEYFGLEGYTLTSKESLKSEAKEPSNKYKEVINKGIIETNNLNYKNN